jgi:hypothetical protein
MRMQTSTKARKPSQQEEIPARFFLKAIDDGGTFSTDYRKLYGLPDTLLEQSPEDAYKQRLASVVSGEPWPLVTGGELVASLLREYTDDWLATGIDDRGEEAPYTRKLTQAKRALRTVQWYEHSRFLAGIDWDNGLEHRPRRIIYELTVSVAEKNGAIAEEAKYAAEARAQRFSPKDANHRLLHGLREHQHKKRVEHGSAYSKMPEDIRAAAKIRAAGLFHALMVAPWRYQLAKCKRCYTYFTLNIRPSKTPYVRGMHCPACKSIASADASAKTKRAEREEQLLSMAAEVWPSWRPAPRFGERKVWVAKRVSTLLGERNAIQRNWVTRHEKDIVAKVKERAHAKG